MSKRGRHEEDMFRWFLRLESHQALIQSRIESRLTALATQTEVLSYLNNHLQTQLKDAEWKLRREQERVAHLERSFQKSEDSLAQERKDSQRLERELLDLRAERQKQDVALSKFEERRKRLRRSIQEIPRRMTEGDEEGIREILEEAREHLKN